MVFPPQKKLAKTKQLQQDFDGDEVVFPDRFWELDQQFLLLLQCLKTASTKVGTMYWIKLVRENVILSKKHRTSLQEAWLQKMAVESTFN